eukprot:TRINITY_DN7168_c0_g1_i1.p1 TRINITY_DN7168_c0_g1~~TRINITY_DN7168_c0_g1_i1.p1  ORF type:complete len:535 (+),score=125.42 TRINITY_DN7168_c0_g1_i1:52-1656(+)
MSPHMRINVLHGWDNWDKIIAAGLVVIVVGCLCGSAGKYFSDGSIASLVWEVVLCILVGIFSGLWISERARRRRDTVMRCNIRDEEGFVSVGTARPLRDTRCFSAHVPLPGAGPPLPESPEDHVLTRQESAGFTASQCVTVTKAAPAHYKRLHPLGQSSTPGVTLHAVISSTGELLAVKTMEAKTKKMLDQLNKEVKILEKLHHPHVVSFVEMRSEGLQASLYEELGDQGTLRELLNNLGSLPVWGLKFFGKQIAEGVAYLHSQDILHRDLKADNILLFARGVVKIADFGEACTVEETTVPPMQEKRANLHGSAFWMAPEAIEEGRYDKSSDVWSLGATLHEMATGRPPFVNETKLTGSTDAVFYVSKKLERKELPHFEANEFGDLLRRMLVYEQGKRLTAEDVALDGWFVPDGDDAYDDSISDKPSQVSMSTSTSVSFAKKSPDDKRRQLMYNAKKMELSNSRHRAFPRTGTAHSVASTTGAESSTYTEDGEVVDVTHTTLAIAMRLLMRIRGPSKANAISLSALVSRGTPHP